MTAHELGATVGTWNSLVRRARMADKQKLAALVVSSYADPDGTGIHCGVTRLAVDLGASYRTAQRYLSWLREVGLIELVRAGNRRKRLSDEYRLILGPDVLEHIEVLDPTRYDSARTEMREARMKSNQASSRNDAQSAPESAAPEGHQASSRVSYKDRDQASNPSRSGVTQDVPPPTNITSPGRSTSPADERNLRTDVTGPRASAESTPEPTKCSHGFKTTTRDDGTSSCALCRREQRNAPPEPDPDPPPDPDRPRGCAHSPMPGKDRCRTCAAERVAPVISLKSRRTA